MPDTEIAAVAQEHEAGRLTAYKNRAHEPGNKQPAFKGTIHPEGTTDPRPLALWARISKKTGDTYFTGKAGETAATQIDKIAAGEPEDDSNTPEAETEQAVKPHQVRLFKNTRKEPGTKQPDYFGYYNPGDGTKLQRLDAWAKNDKYGKPMLSGAVKLQKAEKKKELAKEQEQEAAPQKKKKRALAM